MSQTMPPKVLLLSSAEIEESMVINDAFVTKLNELLQGTCQLEWQNYRNIGLEIDSHTLKAFIVSDGRPLSDFKAVYFKSYFRYHEQAATIVEALKEAGIPFVGKELETYIPASKLSQMARLSRANILIPHTLYLPTEHYVAQYEKLQSTLGQKFIFKAIDGSTGEDNYLVTSQAQLAEIVAANGDRHFIAQSFVPNDSDLRVLVVGGEVKLVIERRRRDDSTHLNNTSQGAQASLLPLETISEELQSLSLQAARIMGREVAGVDVMLEKDTQKPYILEVNASPQIGSGAFEAEKLAIYTEYFKKLAA